MKYLQPLRLATYLLLFFAFAHTKGGLFTHTDPGVLAEAVWQGMQNIHYDFMGQQRTYYDSWIGFGLTATLLLLVVAALAWGLAALDKSVRRQVNFVLWVLCLGMLANAVLAFKYFFPFPGILSVAVALLFAFQAWKDRSA